MKVRRLVRVLRLVARRVVRENVGRRVLAAGRSPIGDGRGLCCGDVFAYVGLDTFEERHGHMAHVGDNPGTNYLVAFGCRQFLEFVGCPEFPVGHAGHGSGSGGGAPGQSTVWAFV